MRLVLSMLVSLAWEPLHPPRNRFRRTRLKSRLADRISNRDVDGRV